MAALFDRIGDQFLSYYGSMQGAVRGEVIRQNLAPCLKTARSALDIGCGEGLDALWLVERGLHVTAIDPSKKMLAAARTSATRLSSSDRLRLRLINCDLHHASEQIIGQQFDLVLCHGVMMYQNKDAEFLTELRSLLRDNGLLSLVVRNADALAYRAAANGDFAEAQRLIIGQSRSMGRMGVASRAHRISELTGTLRRHGLAVEDWFGVKVFCDSLTGPVDPTTIDALIDLEVAASNADPYRAAGRLLHLLARAAA